MTILVGMMSTFGGVIASDQQLRYPPAYPLFADSLDEQALFSLSAARVPLRVSTTNVACSNDDHGSSDAP